MSDFTPNAFQPDFFGGSKRVLPWKNILRKIILQVGDRQDLEEDEYDRKIAGLLYSNLPAMSKAIEAIIAKRDPEFGRQVIEKFFQLSVVDVPAPDTVPRATRDAKKELKKEGRLERKIKIENEASFNDLLVEAEKSIGIYNSGIEARFKVSLKRVFPVYYWEENKRLMVQSGPYKGRHITPDFLCERLGLSIEIDSFEFHKDCDSFIDDRQKARIMQQLGYYHLQFSGQELSIPGGIENAMMEIEWFIEHRCENGKQVA